MYHRALIEENKWRAARWGIEGKLIDFGKQAEVPMGVLAEELLEFVDDVLDELGSRAALAPIHTIFREGTSAERQLSVYKETGDLQAVVRHIVNETRSGVPLQAIRSDAAQGRHERTHRLCSAGLQAYLQPCGGAFRPRGIVKRSGHQSDAAFQHQAKGLHDHENRNPLRPRIQLPPSLHRKSKRTRQKRRHHRRIRQTRRHQNGRARRNTK